MLCLSSKNAILKTKRELSRRRWCIESVRMLCAAAGAGECGLLLALIEVVACGQTDEKATRHRRRFVRWNRNRALRMAAANGRTRCVELLLLHGADAGANSHQALCSAARAGHVDTVILLLDVGGTDVDVFDVCGARAWQPLRQSLWRGHSSVTEELLRRVPDRRNCVSSPWERKRFTPFDNVFRQAIRAGDERLLRVLISKDIPFAPCDGLLMDVAWHDRLHMLRILTDDLFVPSGLYDATTVYDMALERVVSYGTVDCADLLLQWGAAFRGGGIKTREEALAECVFRNRKDMVRWLIERAGADVRSSRDPTNRLPLLGWCVMNDENDDACLLELLLRSGADVHEPYLDANGPIIYGIHCMDGPLYVAVMEDRPNCVWRLLEWGSDIGVARLALKAKRRFIDRCADKEEETSSIVSKGEEELRRIDHVLERWEQTHTIQQPLE